MMEKYEEKLLNFNNQLNSNCNENKTIDKIDKVVFKNLRHMYKLHKYQIQLGVNKDAMMLLVDEIDQPVCNLLLWS